MPLLLKVNCSQPFVVLVVKQDLKIWLASTLEAHIMTKRRGKMNFSYCLEILSVC